MNKLFKLFLTGAAISAALVGFVSCQKDLEPEIENLKQQVTQLTQKLTDLENSIKSGEIVTAVTSTTGGITVQTNKGTYNITNGKDGKDGTNGKDGKDGTVWTIGDDGFWYKDGAKQNYKAVGTDGTNGKDGVNGKDGQNGEYYVPNPETGCFDKYTWNAEKKEYVKAATTISYVAPGAITAVWDAENNQLIFKGIEGKDPYTITLLADVKSLVFMPSTYIDGVEAMLFENFTYVPQVLNKKDSKDEIQVAKTVKVKDKTGKEVEKEADPVPVQPGIIAQYHVNPANANLSFLEAGTSKGLSYVVVPNAKKIETKAEASKDFAVTPIFKSFEKGVLTVEVQVTGTPATDDLLSVIALEIEKLDGEFVTSDYATLMKQDLDDVVIAFKNSYAKDNLDEKGEKKDAHLRRASEGISVADAEAYISDYAAWTSGEDAIEDAEKTCDVSVKYNSSLDLKTIVAAHTIPAENATSDVELTAADLEKLGLTWEFAVVKNYKIGKKGSETDQANFVNLDNGVFIPKVYEEEGVAAIGRTPIIRVALKHGDDVLQYAYIKVFISDKEDTTEPFDAEYIFDDGFEFSCAADGLELLTTVKYMNLYIYNKLMDKEQFHALYNNFNDDYVVLDEKGKAKWTNVGTVTEVENVESEGTHILKWVVTAEEAWELAGKEIVHYVAYENKENPKLKAVIKLVANVDAFKKEYNVPAADYIPAFWNDEPEKNITYYNVFTPDTGETDPTKCIFQTDINISFRTWTTMDKDPKTGEQLGTLGSLKLTDDPNGVVTSIEYFFCREHNEKIKKIGDLDVLFKVDEADSTILLATLDVKNKNAEYEEIAKITNEAVTLKTNGLNAPNSLEINKESEIAKKLVNTDALYFFLGAKGYVCDDEEKPVGITFQKTDHFRVNVVRPVDLGAVSGDYFVDARDFGEPHTFIRLEDLINPVDWRNRQFKNYPNYWQYYGIEKIEVAEDMTWDAVMVDGKPDGVPENIVVEADYETKEITIGEGKDAKTYKSDYGFLCYRNGNLKAKNFNFFVKVKVTYAWGVIETTEITVPVHETEIL